MTYNLLVTSLIVGRLWLVSRSTKLASGGFQDGVYLRVMLALSESGAIYLATLAVYLGLFISRVSQATGVGTSLVTDQCRLSAQNNASVIVLAALPVIAGVVPTAIILVRPPHCS